MNDFYSFRKVVIQEELQVSEMDYFHPAVTSRYLFRDTKIHLVITN